MVRELCLGGTTGDPQPAAITATCKASPFPSPFPASGNALKPLKTAAPREGKVIGLELMQNQAWLFPAPISRPHPPHPRSQTPQRTPPHRARGLPPGAGRLATGPHRRPGPRRPGLSGTRAATTPGGRVSLPGAEPKGAQRLQASCARRPWTPWGCPARRPAQPGVRGPLEGRPARVRGRLRGQGRTRARDARGRGGGRARSSPP